MYLEDLVRGRSVLELGGDARTAALLKEKGAQVVTQRPSAAAIDSAGYGLVLALDAKKAELAEIIAAARRVLIADGTLVVACESADRPGANAEAAVSFFALQDNMASEFAEVHMHGLAPMVGATLVQYGVKDPEPMLDSALVPKGEKVAWYVAVAGPKSERVRPYGVLPVPLEALVGAPVASTPASAPPRTAPSQKTTAPSGDAELREQLRARERGLEEARQGALLHSQEMAAVRHELDEAKARLAELERDGREGERVRELWRADKARADKAETSEREVRRRLAEVEGKLLAYAQSAQMALPTTDEGLRARVTELQAENAKLKAKEEEARAESWKAMKARADAEAQAAEVREDTVRKLKDARKLASIDLTRATEEAMKKAVTLKEELQRSERERKELKADLENARAEIERLAAGAGIGSGGTAEAEARATQLQLEKERLELLLEAEAERARSAREELAERTEEVARLRRSPESGN